MSGLVGLLDGLRGKLRQQVDRVAGIAYHEGMLYVAGLERTETSFEIAFLESVMLQAEDAAWETAVAEKSVTILARKGWNDVPVVLAIDAQEVETMEAALPFSDSPKESQQMAHFEAARQLHREQQAFLSASVSRTDGGQDISVYDVSRADELRQICQAAGINLFGIAAPPPSFCLLCEGRTLSWDGHRLQIADVLLESDGAFHGWNESFSLALYGAILLVQAVPEAGVLFPLKEVERFSWAYGRIALLAAAVWLAALLVVTVFDLYGWYGARQEAEKASSDLALLYGDAQHMEDARAEDAWIERQEQALQQLTAERSPAASVLVHLGTQNTDGVRLDEITMEQGKPAVLKGQAVTYDALSAYVQGFERDRAFFPDGPVLLDSTRPGTEDDDTIHFSIELRHAGEEGSDDEADGT